MYLYINNVRTNYTVISACNFIQRASGLIFRKEITVDEVFHIQPCNSVHSFGMKYDIDIVYLDKIGAVLKIKENMRKKRINWCFKAHSVLEFKSLESEKLQINIGDIVSF